MSTKGRPPTENSNNQSLWDLFTKGIKPLHKKTPSEAPPQKNKKQTTVEPKGDNSLSLPLPPITEINDDIPKQKPQLDKRRKEKLRKGKIAVEAVLDLHGMTQAQAHQSLMNFINGAATSGKRCVLVITGKGTRSETGVGVLKSNLPVWMDTPPLSNTVLDYVEAHRKHGGSGAYYIYLKRQ